MGISVGLRLYIYYTTSVEPTASIAHGRSLLSFYSVATRKLLLSSI